MGAWGVTTFDNDTACDWKYGLEDVDDLSLVRETLARALTVGDEYLDSDDACEGLAACEVIARLKDNWGVRDAYTESLDKWVEDHPIQPPTDLVNQALAVIDRVLTAPSELMELWTREEKTKSGMMQLRIFARESPLNKALQLTWSLPDCHDASESNTLASGNVDFGSKGGIAQCQRV